MLERFPEITTTLLSDGQDYCRVWPFRQLPDSFWDLPGSSVPTLIFNGRDDVSTPVAGARDLARSLPNAQFVEIAWFGHGDATDCTLAVMKEFLATPFKPVDQRCAMRVSAPAWRMPASLGADLPE